MEWDDAVAFEAVAANLSFSRAAEQLRIAQPAVSLRVRRLERRLAVRLLVRTTRRVEVTAAGHVLAEAVRAMRRCWTDAGARLSAAAHGDARARFPTALPAHTDALTLRAVLHEGCLSRAAAQLYVSEAAVSQRIRRLERRLRLPLLEPAGRQRRATAAGWILAEHLARLVALWEAALRRLADTPACSPAGGQEHLSTVGAQFGRDDNDHRAVLRLTSYPLGVAPLAARIERQLPAMRVITTTANPDDAIRSMSTGDTDIAIGYSAPGDTPTAPAGTVLASLLDEPQCVALPADHHLATRSFVTLSELAGDTWIGPPPGTPLASLCTAAFAAHGMSPPVIHTMESALAIRDFIAHHRAVSLATPLAAGQPDTTICVIPLHPPVYRRIWASWSTHLPSTTTTTTLACICAHYRDLATTATTQSPHLANSYLLFGPHWRPQPPATTDTDS